jgi:hypothetical protein
MSDIHSWQPRSPSARIARELFGREESNAEKARRMERWGWLAPAAACGLTMLLAVGNMNRHAEVLAGNDETNFATEMLYPTSSNTLQQVRLSQADENVQWNIWPKLTPLTTAVSVLSVEDATATNLIR